MKLVAEGRVMESHGYLSVTWRFVPNLDNEEKGAIITNGKWGSENSPALVGTDIQRLFAQHIVELHNARLSASQQG